MEEKLIKQMLEKARTVRDNAYCPYSGFAVGACLLGDDGNLYIGCNIENASYRLTQCAESSALGHLISHGAKRVVKMVLIADSPQIIVPCGACRQQLRELAVKGMTIHMFNLKGESETLTLEELLIKSFGPDHLGE